MWCFDYDFGGSINIYFHNGCIIKGVDNVEHFSNIWFVQIFHELYDNITSCLYIPDEYIEKIERL